MVGDRLEVETKSGS